jgi:Fe-S-cluster-containing hydrogenase component 2
VVYVDAKRCTGCGDCVGICPTDAISLPNGKAVIEESLCTACEACLEVCPQDAILAVEAVEPAVSRQIEPRPPHPADVLPVRPGIRNWALPAIGSALLWTGREILPRLASLAIEALEQRTQSTNQVASEETGGRQRRRRQRRGGR